MSLFSWLLPRKKPVLSLEQQERLLQLPLSAGLSDTSLRKQRWVVVDLETSGLNLNRDQVLSIGAMVIEDGAIDLGQAFERTLMRVNTPLNPSVLLHGLGPSAIAAGCDPADALLDFMTFVGDSPLLAFHAPMCAMPGSITGSSISTFKSKTATTPAPTHWPPPNWP